MYHANITMNQGNSIKDMLIWVVSLFLAASASYLVSDFWIDYKVIHDQLLIILLSIIWFVRVPIAFWFLTERYKETLDNWALSNIDIMKHLLSILLIVCTTLAILIRWKI